MDEKFLQSIQEIVQKDNRYHADAYDFVNKAVSYTVRKMSRTDRPRGSRHVTGQELVNGIMEHAVEQYSFLAPEIFLFWGVTSGPDIGNIVYNMIAVELLSASPEDSKSDFDCMEDLIGELRKKVEPRPEDISVEPPPILDR